MGYTDYSSGTRHIIGCCGTEKAAHKAIESYKKIIGKHLPGGSFTVKRDINGARRYYAIFTIGNGLRVTGG